MEAMRRVFLSHKSSDATAARALAKALDIIVQNEEIFLSEEAIEPGEDYREDISHAIEEAKCFILLYTDPALDWSWCFYEAGCFSAGKLEKRPIYCLHPTDIDPPGPIANLQTVRAVPDGIENWIRNGLCALLDRKQPSAVPRLFV